MLRKTHPWGAFNVVCIVLDYTGATHCAGHLPVQVSTSPAATLKNQPAQVGFSVVPLGARGGTVHVGTALLSKMFERSATAVSGS